MYRCDGPQEMRPIGETEFVNGIAAMSATGAYGPARLCAGIVGHAGFRLGERVQPVLEAHLRAGGNRFRGIRFVAANDPDPAVMNQPGRRLAAPSRRSQVPRGLCPTCPARPVVRCHDLPSATRRSDGPRAGVSGNPHRPRPHRRADRHWCLCRPARRGISRSGAFPAGARALRQRLRQDWWHGATGQRTRLPRTARTAALRNAGRGLAALRGGVHCEFRPGTLHVRKQLSRRQSLVSYATFWNACKRLASGAGAGEKADLFHATACRFYNFNSRKTWLPKTTRRPAEGRRIDAASLSAETAIGIGRETTPCDYGMARERCRSRVRPFPTDAHCRDGE